MNHSITIGIINEGESPRLERRDAAANRQLLLDTARQLFAEQGVANVHMADIAQAAGVGKGTLYRRFAHKGELCLNLLNDELQQFQNTTLAELRQKTAAGRSYLEQLDYFLDGLVGFVVDNLPLMCEIANVPAAADNIQDINRPHFWQEMTVRALLRQASIHYQLNPQIDLDYTASAFIALLDARIIRFQVYNQGFTKEQISRGLRQLIDGIT